MPGSHALLSPSAAHRWLNCPAAPRLEAEEPDSGSPFAMEGTLAHAYCARKLKETFGISTHGEDWEITQYSKYHTGEMDEYTDTYAAIVLEKFNTAQCATPDAQLLIETRFDFGDYVPDAYGTSDATIIADGCMEIIDFKYGKGVKVSAVNNPQMMIYALGAYQRHSFEYLIDRVRMTIIQPRIDNLSEWEMSVADLLQWADTELRPKAKAAHEGNAPQNPGEWCQFCKVKGKCKALAEKCTSTVAAHDDPRLIDADVMASDILPQLSLIKSWISTVEEHTLQEALKGVKYPGFKLVEGRSVRKITDPDAVAAVMRSEGYSAEEFMKPAALCGISDLERIVGKKRFSTLCGDYITKPHGKPTLVPADDKRPAYSAAAADFDGIDMNQY